MMTDGMMMNGPFMMAMCIIGMLFFLILTGATIYVVVRLLMKNRLIKDRPLMLLRERYVKGEITDEEYRQKRKLLQE